MTSGNKDGIRWQFFMILPAAALVVGAAAYLNLRGAKRAENVRSYFVQKGGLRQSVQASGIVDPKNKVEILPPVSGRVDRILVDQGTRVGKGRLLAYMSSTDRAAVLDAALSQGPTVYAHWEKAYRPTPVVSPVDGLVIDRQVVEGQTVAAGKNLFVLADRLIVRAKVDESDISRVHMGQEVSVVADAFPDKPFAAKVVLIDYQSRDSGGVTAYQVELEPEGLPAELRSGMTVKAEFLIREAKDAALLPLAAVRGASEAEVELKVRRGAQADERRVKLGFSDGTNVLIESGLQAGDEVLVEAADFGEAPAASPLDPFARRKKKSPGK